jgi:GNAT superfamily N-acetyltransferase
MEVQALIPGKGPQPVTIAPTRPASAAVPASEQDVPTIAAILADAFQADPVFAWCVPDSDLRQAALPAFFDLFARAVARTGEMHLADGGAALWVSPGRGAVPAEEEESFGAAIGEIMGEDAERTFALMAVIEEQHPTTPHYYLPFIGVRAAAQGKGVGSALLRTVLDRCDNEGVPAYLEATSEDNRRLYERHGFVVQRELAVDDSPPLYAMWREPIR